MIYTTDRLRAATTENIIADSDQISYQKANSETVDLKSFLNDLESDYLTREEAEESYLTPIQNVVKTAEELTAVVGDAVDVTYGHTPIFFKPYDDVSKVILDELSKVSPPYKLYFCAQDGYVATSLKNVPNTLQAGISILATCLWDLTKPVNGNTPNYARSAILELTNISTGTEITQNKDYYRYIARVGVSSKPTTYPAINWQRVSTDKFNYDKSEIHELLASQQNLISQIANQLARVETHVGLAQEMDSSYIIDASRSDNILMKINDRALMDVIYSKKLSSNSDHMTPEEASSVTSLGTYFVGNKSIIDFTALKYFTSNNTLNFKGCTNLASISLPQTLTSITASGFTECYSLINIEFPTALKVINNFAFNNCNNLKLTSLPSTLTSIGQYAFKDCSKLNITNLPNTLTTLSAGAFLYCTSLTKMVLPENLTVLNQHTFSNCINLASVTLSTKIKDIPNYFLTNCKSLRSINLPNGITNIGSMVFYGCSLLNLTSLPASVSRICESAFVGCNSITSLRILNTTTVVQLSSSRTDNIEFFPQTTKFYVPSNLFETYKSDQRWKKYYNEGRLFSM